MIFRCKYLIAGQATAIDLYHALKSELETQRYQICDVAEAEVLGPYPESDGRYYPVVPVTFKIETFGYESETTVLFDLFMGVSNLRNELAEQDFMVGLQEVVVDGHRANLDDAYRLWPIPTIEL